jgi:hypothetical protein
MLDGTAIVRRPASLFGALSTIVPAIVFVRVTTTDTVPWRVSTSVHGHEKVRTYGHERSALMATKSPQFWPREVRTPH